MSRVVVLYTMPGDQHCEEIREFLEKQDVRVTVHDVSKNPLSSEQISRLIRHLNLKHFVNQESKQFSKKKLDVENLNRAEVFEYMAEDNDLLVKPIIVSGRLMVVGPNRHKITEMLQLRSNGSGDNGNGEYRSRMGYKAEAARLYRPRSKQA